MFALALETLPLCCTTMAIDRELVLDCPSGNFLTACVSQSQLDCVTDPGSPPRTLKRGSRCGGNADPSGYD
jgi:hypothetical protein